MEPPKRVKRILLAYAIEYEDGSIQYRHILECDDIKDTYEADIDRDRYTRQMYRAGPGRYTITGTGRTLHEWPGAGGWSVEDAPALPSAPLLIQEGVILREWE